ncbi:hypothetical protein ACFBZI_07710 [Moraxella sp. ZJ142]|uniref:hypothetical protein n=1 Tax=Moraxella marmotae TaxID=3344520 RepID=UPI0035D40C51
MIMYVNVACCVAGLSVGLYTFIKHANDHVTDTWLVSVGNLAWAMMGYSILDQFFEHLDPFEITFTRVETFARILFLIYWCGVLLQVQKHCLRYKLKKRKKHEHQKYSKSN